MKIGILTHYDVNNQGAQLQLYALYNQLKGMGNTVSVLTYIKNYDFIHEEKLKNQVSIRSIPYFIKNYLLKKGVGLVYFNAKKYLKNIKFRKEQFIYSDYTTADIDCAVVGSDEVFSIPFGINMMMFGYGLSTDKVFSYAPSFGQTDMALIERHNAKALISSGLKGFAALSARDQHTYDMILQLTGTTAEIVCDPVLLYDFSNITVPIRKIKKKYLLVYSYDRWMTELEEIESICKYAKKKGLITVSAGTYHKWCDINIVCTPLEWIEYFRGAEEVITDTFHGAILSIITNRPTAYYIRSLNRNKMTSLLGYFGLDNRILTNIKVAEIEKIQSTKTDYVMMTSRLNEIRKQSNSFLEGTLNYLSGEKS